MKTGNPQVDWYFAKAGRWQAELQKLRTIALACPLTEELKWGVPCYTVQNGNVVLIHFFKAYCALLFTKGALMRDPEGILIQQTKNVQSARQIRFTSVREVVEMRPILTSYIHEAMELEKAGAKVVLKKPAEFPIAGEFKDALDSNSELQEAFRSLTPGRQRAYLLHFAAAKQSKTRSARVEKCKQRILDGKGLDD